MNSSSAVLTPSSSAAGLAPEQAAAEQKRRDIATISLIGLAHGTSHFFHMLLPPLFPVFIRDFGLSYSQLGLLVTTFFVISGIGQALAGFVVDRRGARPILFAALACFVAASAAAGLAQGFGGLLLAAALAGLGNSPFHPVDFTILNKRVSPARLGHAFSVHGISGNIGWGLAPLFALALSSWSGNWRYAYLGTALLGLAVIAVLAWKREAIDDAHGSWAHEKAGAAAPAPEHPLAFLRLPSVWLCFSFFLFTTASLSAIQSFASPALSALYGLPLAATAFVVTGYMFCGAVGMVIGGFWVAKGSSLERNIAIALSIAAALLILAASGWVVPALAGFIVALAGFGTGLAGPSRDMLIKRAAPPGATGRVYGTVYSGLDIGFAAAAPVFGALLDGGHPGAVFVGAALALLSALSAASLVRRGRGS
ncbi:MFS transporter [Paucibacter aquatile]|uniref:MFS transporter n=1 Tax=Kinneretia aquatilis TaxID=2070761 RepID=A0A2N8KV24_9BURK|nr:MFS transporter [Paucibacter aquatile]PND37319.1 MFS transporter [Paucibacter aquatile]